MQQMWVHQAVCGLVAINVGSLAVSVGSQLLIFARIVGSKAPLFASPGDLVCRPLHVGTYTDSSRGQHGFVATPIQELAALGPAKVWIGLKNSDAVGLRLDLFAEVFLHETKVGEGQLNNIASGSSGFNNAKLNTIPLTLFAPVEVPVDAELEITLSVRRTCFGGGHNSGTSRLWYQDSQANSRFGATIADTMSDFFLRDGFVLATTPGTGPKQMIDVSVDNKTPCPNRPFTPFGTWGLTLP